MRALVCLRVRGRGEGERGLDKEEHLERESGKKTDEH
jgi:hypothetical protein